MTDANQNPAQAQPVATEVDDFTQLLRKEIKPKSKSADDAVSVAELAARLGVAAVEAFGEHGAEAVTAIVEALRSRGLPQLFAKSLIAADDDARHDFNEIVTAQATVLSWRDTRLLGPCELVVHDVASPPVRRYLGLQIQTLPFGFSIELDFRQESGVVRWSSWASPGQRRDRARMLRTARAFGLRAMGGAGGPAGRGGAAGLRATGRRR